MTGPVTVLVFLSLLLPKVKKRQDNCNSPSHGSGLSVLSLLQRKRRDRTTGTETVTGRRLSHGSGLSVPSLPQGEEETG